MDYFESNSFQIPNVLVDKLLCQLTPREVVCLLVIIRQTRGWHRQRDSIPISQFKKFTGISRDKSIQKELDSLRARGFIRIHKQRGKVSEYELTDTYKTKPPTPPKKQPGAETATTPPGGAKVQPVAESATTPGAETATTSPETSGGKRHTSKDNIKTKDSDPRSVPSLENENGHAAEVNSSLRSGENENGHAAEGLSIADYAERQAQALNGGHGGPACLDNGDRSTPIDPEPNSIYGLAKKFGLKRGRLESMKDFRLRVTEAKSIAAFQGLADKAGVSDHKFEVNPDDK